MQRKMEPPPYRHPIQNYYHDSPSRDYHVKVHPPRPFEEQDRAKAFPQRLQIVYDQTTSSDLPSTHQRRGIVSISTEQAKASVEQFGSPYASNEEWRPSGDFEPRLYKLPTLPIGVRIKQRFARSADDVWTPPCPSFQRDIPPNIIVDSFDLINVKGAGKLSSEGFDTIFPGRLMASRDISAADWARFLQDIEVSGRLSGKQGIIANVAPLTMHMSATGYFVTKAIQKGMSRRKEPLIYETVEEWNYQFFSKRGLQVHIRNKTERLTATSIGGQIQPLSGQLGNKYINECISDDESTTSKESKKTKEKEKKQQEKQKKDKKKTSLFLVIAPKDQKQSSD